MANMVSLHRCESYDEGAVKAAVLRQIDGLGGLGKYISPGERVLLKVNLLMKKKPEDATTTHPAVVKALAEILIAHGCAVTIGDSPGGPFTEGMLRGIYAASGMERIARETGASLNRNCSAASRENPDGLLLKKLIVTDMLNDADKVISVSKLKTHGMMTFTGAVKNMFGTVPGVVKAEYHMNMPRYDDFADALLDICLCANPVLSFMDGIEAMEGHGPSGGRARKMNVLLASDSPLALDKTACAVISLAEERVPVLYRAAARGLCGEGLADIAFTGEPWESFAVTDFDIPPVRKPMTYKAMPKPVLRFANRHLQPRPVFDRKLCVGCADCAKNCPAKVIRMRDKKPVVSLEGCIRCFCCQELCPKTAVSVYRPRLLRLVSRPKRK